QNLMSVVRLSRLAVPSMKAHGWGRIINITALSVKAPVAGFGLSVATWAGLIGFSKTLSRELGPDGITVNTICPGRIDTELLKRSLKAQAEIEKRPVEQVLADAAKRIPLKRLGRPEEIGAVAAFLASERASYVTGTTIQVDGGSLESLI
ncbi:MAG: SDR family oxidoreductase, partial [Alphaproteobacteria bacterium]